MKKAGVAELPLHTGKAPNWLVSRMIKLAKSIVSAIIDEYGQEEFLRRISNPYFFQSLGCALGYDWHSSGVTTVLTGVLRCAIVPEVHGIVVTGGKGRRSTQTLSEIESIGRRLEVDVQKLIYASRMCAKVDNAAIQSGHKLYHHTFIFTLDGKWAVVQQGMNVNDKTARRYHWLSESVRCFVDEPHSAIVCDVKKESVLDMTAKISSECRKTCVDLVREGPSRIKRDLLALVPKNQELLDKWLVGRPSAETRRVYFLKMPKEIDWSSLKRAYEKQPKNYEELLSIKGIGPATVKALALISELIYGSPPSWRDPVKYSFAFGGKDGVPRPVDRKAMDEAISFLEAAVNDSKMGKDDRKEVLRRLRTLI